MIPFSPQEHPMLVSNERTDLAPFIDPALSSTPVPSPFSHRNVYSPAGPADYATPNGDEPESGPSRRPTVWDLSPGSRKRTMSKSPSETGDDRGSSRKSKKFSRTRQGCLTCRSRKVKCGEEKPVCRKCQIGGRECAWQDEENTPKTRIIYRYSPVPIAPHPGPSAGITSHPQAPTEVALQAVAGPSNAMSLRDPFIPASLHDFDMTSVGTFSRQPDFETSSSHLQAQMMDAPPPRFVHAPVLDTAAMSRAGQYVPFPRGYHPVATPIKPIDALDVVREMVPSNMRLTLISNPEFLRPYFPSTDERLIIHHYFHNTINIIMAFHPELKPWNPWLNVHAAMAFNNVPGQCGASDALRLAMITVGSVHLHYLSNPTDQTKALKMVRTARKTIMNQLRATMDDKDADLLKKPTETCDIALGALLSCTIASSLVGDDAWQDILTAGVTLIDQNGGAANLMRFASRKHMSPYRFCLEQMAVRDVFGCMTTGMPPTILNSAFVPWFFEAEAWSKDAGEWESVERMFGISRGVVDLIARACAIGAQVRNTGLTVMEHNAEIRTDTDRAYDRPSDAFNLRLPTKFNISRSIPGRPSPAYASTSQPDEHHTRNFGDPRREALEDSANQLMAEIRVWQETANFVCHSPRTQYGNHAHRHAMRIYLLRNVFGASKDDPRVQTSACAILELAKELLSAFGKIVWFTWPVLIAGVHMPQGDPGRRSALELMGEFSPHACFDNQKAGRVLQEFWKTYDANPDLDPSWWSMMDAIGIKAFFD